MDYFKLTGANKLLKTDRASAALYYDKGYIGMFDCLDAKSGSEILRLAVDELSALGHKKIIAPIDNNTWFSYRTMCYDSGLPTFPLEKLNPLWHNKAFEMAGFKPLKEFFSYTFEIEQKNLKARDDIEIRHIAKANFDCEIKIIYDVSMCGFADNFLFSPIDFESFRLLYQGALPLLDERFFYIAEANNKPIAFLFCYDGGDGRFVLKSMAIEPSFRERGIGTHLIELALSDAYACGFRTAIGAYIRMGNHSGKIVQKHKGEILRKYRLYQWEQ